MTYEPPAALRHGRAFAAILALAACGAPASNPDAPVDGLGDASVDRVTVTVAAGGTETFSVVSRDGEGPWQQLVAASDGTYAFPVTDRYGVGVTCATAVVQEATFVFATLAERSSVEIRTNCGFDGVEPPSHVAGVTVSGLSGVGVTLGLLDPVPRSIFVAGVARVEDPNPTISLGIIAAEPTANLFAGRFAGGTDHVDRLLIRRAVPTMADTGHVVDFATQGNPTESRPVSIAGAAASETPGVVALVRARPFTFPFATTRSTRPPLAIDVPAAAEWDGDFELAFFASLRSPDDVFRSVRRSYTSYADVPASFDVEPPPAPGPVSITTLPSGGRHALRLAWTPPPVDVTEYQLFVTTFYDDPACADGSCFPTWFIGATPAWLDSGTPSSLALVTPTPSELEAIGAWNPRLDLRSGIEARYSLTASSARPDGFEYRSERGGTIVP
jgi:hypothetical protein